MYDNLHVIQYPGTGNSWSVIKYDTDGNILKSVGYSGSSSNVFRQIATDNEKVYALNFAGDIGKFDYATGFNSLFNLSSLTGFNGSNVEMYVYGEYIYIPDFFNKKIYKIKKVNNLSLKWSN